MGSRFLLDANVLSEPIKPRPSPRLLQKLDQYRNRLATAATVVHELLYGLERLRSERKRADLAAYLTSLRATLPILPYDDRAAAFHARERARLESQGRTVSLADLQISAVASVNDCILVTANLRHFADVQGLEVVDWTG